MQKMLIDWITFGVKIAFPFKVGEESKRRNKTEEKTTSYNIESSARVCPLLLIPRRKNAWKNLSC